MFCSCKPAQCAGQFNLGTPHLRQGKFNLKAPFATGPIHQSPRLYGKPAKNQVLLQTGCSGAPAHPHNARKTPPSMNLLKALAAVSSMTLVSRVLGFVRDAIIARVFGAGL